MLVLEICGIELESVKDDEEEPEEEEDVEEEHMDSICCSFSSFNLTITK